MNKGFLKKFTGDLLYGIVSLVFMNMVLSLVVYPFLNRQLGDAGQGRMLFFTSLMGLVASAAGSGINYGRMKASTKHQTENGDYTWYLLALAAVSCLVTIVGFAVKGSASGATGIGVAVLIFATAVRYYADVEYRLYMNYRGFFLYYMIIGVGYLGGMLLYRVTSSWVCIFLCGELAGLCFVACRGHIFKGNLWKRSPYFSEDAKICLSLSAAYLMSDFVSYTDRILLSVLSGDAQANYFYIASLVGKMTSLLSTPLNGVITGHLSHYKGKFTAKMFGTVMAALLGLAAVITAGSVVGSHLFVWLFYREQYPLVKDLFLLANAGQVFFFLSNTMMVVVLRFASERYQLLMGIIYTVLFFVIVVPAIYLYGLWGAAWGLLAVNVLKFFLIGAMGFFALKKGGGKEGEV